MSLENVNSRHKSLETNERTRWPRTPQTKNSTWKGGRDLTKKVGLKCSPQRETEQFQWFCRTTLRREQPSGPNTVEKTLPTTNDSPRTICGDWEYRKNFVPHPPYLLVRDFLFTTTPGRQVNHRPSVFLFKLLVSYNTKPHGRERYSVNSCQSPNLSHGD